MTFVLCSILNEREALERMWESVRTHIPGAVQLVVVDGRFTDFDATEDFSTDGTKEYAQAHGHYLQVVDYECEKRSAGLRYIDSLANDGDFVLVMDADETLTGFMGFPSKVGYISFERKRGLPVTYGRCRMYRWEPGLYFKGRHYDIFRANGELLASLEDAPEFDVVGTGNHYEKPRTEAKVDYYRTLREREGSPWEVAV